MTSEEREKAEALTKNGKHDSGSVLLGRALRLADSPPEGPVWRTKDIVEALGISPRTIERMKRRFVEEGLERALERKPPDLSPRGVKFDGVFEAKLMALARSDPSEGRGGWTIRLLSEKAVELGITDPVSPMTVQRTLKKTKLNLDRKKFHKTTPESHAAFVAAMEDVLGVYLYSRPVVPMDESDRRLAAEARAPTRPGKGAG